MANDVIGYTYEPFGEDEVDILLITGSQFETVEGGGLDDGIRLAVESDRSNFWHQPIESLAVLIENPRGRFEDRGRPLNTAIPPENR